MLLWPAFVSSAHAQERSLSTLLAMQELSVAELIASAPKEAAPEEEEGDGEESGSEEARAAHLERAHADGSAFRRSRFRCSADASGTRSRVHADCYDATKLTKTQQKAKAVQVVIPAGPIDDNPIEARLIDPQASAAAPDVAGVESRTVGKDIVVSVKRDVPAPAKEPAPAPAPKAKIAAKTEEPITLAIVESPSESPSCRRLRASRRMRRPTSKSWSPTRRT